MKRTGLLTMVFAMVMQTGVIYSQELPDAPPEGTVGRVASIYLSENLINQLLKENLTSPVMKDVVLNLDAQNNQIAARGLIKIPIEDLRAINLEPGLSDFRFQIAIRLKVTKQGHLILIFPLDQTYFYPATSTNSVHDRIVIPVQLLSLALASARGYLAMCSGDFSGFDKKTQELTAQVAVIDKQIAAAQDPDDKASLRNDRKSLDLQLQAIPVERKQGEKIAKKVQNILGFVGEKEINLNDQLVARKNALILRIQLGNLVPYLDGIELGGIRLVRDDKDGAGMNFLGIDITAPLVQGAAPQPDTKHPTRPKTDQRPPDIMIRLNQAIFESQTLLDAEKGETDSHIKNLKLDIREDGIHVKGDWKLVGIPIPFYTSLQLVWTGPNVFEIHVSKIKVVHLDIKPIARVVLDIFKNRLDRTLKGVCTFEYIGTEKDGTLGVRVTTDMAHLVPAFPKLALIGVATKDKILILKAGQP